MENLFITNELLKETTKNSNQFGFGNVSEPSQEKVLRRISYGTVSDPLSAFVMQNIIKRNSILYLFYLCVLLVLLSGCRNRNNQNINENDNTDQKTDIDDTDKIYFLDFETNLENIPKDTFTINSIAKNITFIPLETSDTVLLYNDVIKIEKISVGFLISSSSFYTAFHYIMAFDSTGRFRNYLVKRGQGPYELPFISEWAYNHNSQLLVASTGYQFVLHLFENQINKKLLLDGYWSDVCLLNDGTIVGLPNSSGKGDTDTPYLHFLNQEGKTIRSYFYAQKRNIFYNQLPGEVLAHVEKYGLYPNYSGDALFKDMFNDTIYKIKNMDDVSPYIILHKGALTPTLKDINNPTTAAQKVKLTQILDTNKYFIICYGYKSSQYTSIWEKQTQKLIANTLDSPRTLDSSRPQISRLFFFQGCTKYRTPTDKEIVINISSYYDGHLYCILDAEQAMEFLPDVDYDDNPVLMVIEI